MKLKLNPEYCRNHLFVTILMFGLGIWFAYDGFVKYPSLSGEALYESIEKAKPAPGVDLEAFKAQKIQTQHGFALFAIIVSGIVGFRLFRSSKFDFSYDESGFSSGASKHSYDEIVSVDDSQWEKKAITKISTKNDVYVLDGWHHLGVSEFHGIVKGRQK